VSLDRAALQAALQRRAFIGKSLELHESIGSTNDRAKQLGAEGAAEGTVVLAEEQTGGRGRLGRAWSSPRGGLYCSILLRPDDALLKRAPITLVAGLAASEALDAAARVATSLKWPNDVLLDGKKIGGVLGELTKVKGGNVLVLGVGLNIDILPGAWNPEVRAIATSILAAKGRAPAIEEVFRHYVEHLEAHYDHLRKGGGPLLLSKAADRMPLLRGRVRVKVEGKTLEGQASGLNATGALVISLDDGKREIVYAGEVEEVRPV
jgi:BirA family biotin operon repressor/biotin-[acetyl-CoA-carboxylase] ligase